MKTATAFLVLALGSGYYTDCHAEDFSRYSIISEKTTTPSTITATITKSGQSFCAEYRFITEGKLEDRLTLSTSENASPISGLAKFVIRDIGADGTIDIIELDDKISLVGGESAWSVETGQVYNKQEIDKLAKHSQNLYNIYRNLLNVELRRNGLMRLPKPEELPY